MFDNIGGKIKALAEVVCILGIILSIIGGFIIIAENSGLLGFMFMVIGSLGSWVSSFTLFGFGQLIENTDLLVKMANKQHSRKKTKSYKGIKDDLYTEDASTEDVQKEAPQKHKPKDFLTEIKETKTADLELILQDQKELYTEEEFSVIEKELASRK